MFQRRRYMVSIDFHTIIQRSVLLTSFSPFFPSFTFNLFCFLTFLCQRVVLLNLLDTKVNPNCLLFSQRERERVAEVQPWVGWSGGAMVLGKVSVPRGPTYLDNSRVRACCACSRCGWELFRHFFSRLSFLFSFSLFGRRPDIDWNSVSKGR